MSDVTGYDDEVLMGIDEESGQEDLTTADGLSIFKDENERDEFVSYIQQEVEVAKAERVEQIGMWQKWRRQREARPERKVKNYPFPKSSNVAVPLTSITSQGTYGNLKASFTAKDPIWSIKAINREDEGARKEAESLTEYYGILAGSKYELDIRAKNRDILYEAGTLGTCWVKVFWDERHWRFKRKNPSTGEPETVSALLHQGPSVLPLPLEDVLYRNAVQDVQRMPWVAHHFVMSKQEVEDAMGSGVFEYSDEVLDFETRYENDPSVASIMERMGIEEVPEGVLDFYEVHFKHFDTVEGMNNECMVTIHLPTGVILQEAYSTTGVRPFEPVVYMQRPFYLNGIGAAWLSEGMQDEADTLHNLRIDNMHIGMLKMFATRKTSGVQPNERLYAGKIFRLNNVDDLKVLPMGGVSMQSEQAEFMSKDYAQRATGMNDNSMGFADATAKSGDTFRGQQARMSRSNKMFGSVIEGIEDSYSRIGMLIYMELVNHSDEVIAKERKIGRMPEEKISLLEKALSVPLEELPMRMQFSVKSTDIDETFDQKKQNLLFQVQLQNMFYDRMLPMAMQMSNPQLPKEARMLAMQVYTASARTLEKILKFFNEDDTDKYVPAYRKLEIFSELMQQVGELGYERAVRQLLSQVGGGDATGRQTVSGPMAIPGSQGGLGGRPGGGQPTGGTTPPAAPPAGPVGPGTPPQRGIPGGR